VAGAGGTFTFRVRSLDFHRCPVPPDTEPSRTLFTVWANGYVPASYALPEDAERDLRRNQIVTGVRMTLKRAVTVEGRVFRPHGQAASNWWVRLDRRTENGGFEGVRHTRTNEQGWYRFDTFRAEPGLSIIVERSENRPPSAGGGRRTRSERVPLDDDIAPGDRLHIDLQAGPWAPK
jgi:hypothetical protein